MEDASFTNLFYNHVVCKGLCRFFIKPYFFLIIILGKRKIVSFLTNLPDMNKPATRHRSFGADQIVPLAANFYNLNKCCVDANDHLVHNSSSEHKSRHAYVAKGRKKSIH